MFRNVIITCSLLLSVFSLLFSVYSKEDLVFVDTGKLFADFKMSKELNKQMEGIQTARKSVLDSLYRNLTLATQEAKAKGEKDTEKLNHIYLMQDEFNYRQQKFQEENAQIMNDYNSKIFAQLNEYINEYGKKNKYTFVFGANGQGSLMFASDKKDITNEILEYINSRYDDKVK